MGAVIVPAPIREIQSIVAEWFGVPRSELLTKGRCASIVRARHVAMALVRDQLGASYPEIGRAFGARDHTTALQAVRKVRKALEGKNRHQDLAAAYRAISAGFQKREEPAFPSAIGLSKCQGLRVRVRVA